MIDLNNTIAPLSVLDILRYVDNSNVDYAVSVDEHGVEFRDINTMYKYRIPVSVFNVDYDTFMADDTHGFAGADLVMKILKTCNVNIRRLTLDKFSIAPSVARSARYYCSANVMLSFTDTTVARGHGGIKLRCPIKGLYQVLNKPSYPIDSSEFRDVCVMINTVVSDKEQLLKVWPLFAIHPTMKLFEIDIDGELNTNLSSLLDKLHPDIPHALYKVGKSDVLKLGNYHHGISPGSDLDEYNYLLMRAVEFVELLSDSPYTKMYPERDICKYVYFCNELKELTRA